MFSKVQRQYNVHTQGLALINGTQMITSLGAEGTVKLECIIFSIKCFKKYIHANCNTS